MAGQCRDQAGRTHRSRRIGQGTQHQGDRLASIDGLGGREALIAPAARRPWRIAEIAQNGLGAAAAGFAKGGHGFKAGGRAGMGIEKRGARGQGPAAQGQHLMGAVSQHGLCRRAVPARASDLLPVGLQAVGNVQMGHEANIGPVHPHTERHRCGHHRARPVHEPPLGGPAVGCVETRMIGRGRNTAFAQHGRRAFGPLAGPAIDQRRAGPLSFDQPRQPVRAVVAVLEKGERDIGAGESGPEQTGALKPQMAADIVEGPVIGGAGQRKARHFGPATEQRAEILVGGPEIMPPLRDAMGLVERDERQGHALQHAEKRRGRGALGRDV